MIRPNQIEFTLESHRMPEADAVATMQRSLDPAVEGVVAGLGDAVDTDDPPAHSSDVLYTSYDDDWLVVESTTSAGRAGEFLGVLDHVGAETTFRRGRVEVQCVVDATLTAADVDAPDPWTVDVRDVEEGTAVRLRSGTLEGPTALSLADRLDTVAAVLEPLTPDVEPAGDEPADPVEAYYRVLHGDRLADAPQNAFLQALHHSRGAAGSIDTFRGKREGTTLRELSVAVVEEALDRADLASLDDVHPKFARLTEGPDEDVEATVAALVEGSATLLAVEYAYGEDGETHQETDHHLVAREGGDWRLVS
jgi:hypothetical protein